MTQTTVSPGRPIDSPCQHHGYKVIGVKSVYIESYHIDKSDQNSVTVNRLCVQWKVEAVQFTELKGVK